MFFKIALQRIDARQECKSYALHKSRGNGMCNAILRFTSNELHANKSQRNWTPVLTTGRNKKS